MMNVSDKEQGNVRTAAKFHPCTPFPHRTFLGNEWKFAQKGIFYHILDIQ